MKGKLIGYIRVSSADQNTERQLDGIALDKVFTDHASGKDTKRPQLSAALDYLRDSDTLVVHSMDRQGQGRVQGAQTATLTRASGRTEAAHRAGYPQG